MQEISVTLKAIKARKDTQSSKRDLEMVKSVNTDYDCDSQNAKSANQAELGMQVLK